MYKLVSVDYSTGRPMRKTILYGQLTRLRKIAQQLNDLSRAGLFIPEISHKTFIVRPIFKIRNLENA